VIREGTRLPHQHRAQAGPPWNRAPRPLQKRRKTPANRCPEARASARAARAPCHQSFWDAARSVHAHPPEADGCRRPQSHSDPSARGGATAPTLKAAAPAAENGSSVPPATRPSAIAIKLGKPGPGLLRVDRRPPTEHPSQHRATNHRPQAQPVRAWGGPPAPQSAVEAPEKPIPRGRSAVRLEWLLASGVWKLKKPRGGPALSASVPTSPINPLDQGRRTGTRL